MIPLTFAIQVVSMVDSQLETTRVYWRKRYWQATEFEAIDPRPWAIILNERDKSPPHGYDHE